MELKYRPVTPDQSVAMLVAAGKWKEAAELGPPAVELLAKALWEKPEIEIAVGLGRTKDPRTVRPLIKAIILNPNDGVAPAARQALVEFGPAAFEGLIATLKDDNFETRSIAAEFLGNLKDRRAVGPLVAALKDAYRPDTAIDALVKLRAPAVEPLLAKLKDLDPYVREYAATAPRPDQGRRAVEPLVAALEGSCAARAERGGPSSMGSPIHGGCAVDRGPERPGLDCAKGRPCARSGPGRGAAAPAIAALADLNPHVREAAARARWYPGRSRRRTVARRLERP